MKTKIMIEFEFDEVEYTEDDVYMGFINLLDVCPHKWKIIEWK